jgi:hypothetical protein
MTINSAVGTGRCEALLDALQTELGGVLTERGVRRWNCSGSGHSQAVKRPRSGSFRRDR